MAILLVDVGNSTADFRVWEKGQIHKLTRPVTDNTVFHKVEEFVKIINDSKYNIESIIYSSVVVYYNDIIESLASILKVPSKKITIEDFNVKDFDIKEVDEVGADFLCNYKALISENYKDCICVSMGTATTIFVVENNRFIGATISPGIELFARSLFQGTDLISKLSLAHDKKLAIGKNTKQALDVGVFNAHFYMIEGLINKIKEKHNINNVVFTGGNCFKFLDLISDDNYKFIEDLIFIGLSKFI